MAFINAKSPGVARGCNKIWVRSCKSLGLERCGAPGLRRSAPDQIIAQSQLRSLAETIGQSGALSCAIMRGLAHRVLSRRTSLQFPMSLTRARCPRGGELSLHIPGGAARKCTAKRSALSTNPVGRSKSRKTFFRRAIFRPPRAAHPARTDQFQMSTY